MVATLWRDPYPLTCNQGEDHTFFVELKRENDRPYNLTGCTVQCQICDAIGTLIAKPSCSIIDAETGRVSVTILQIDSAKAGLFFYNFKIISAGGRVDFLPVSSFKIIRSSYIPSVGALLLGQGGALLLGQGGKLLISSGAGQYNAIATSQGALLSGQGERILIA